MNLPLRIGCAAFLCACVSGCGIWPAVGANLAAQGAYGVAALTLTPLAEMQERSEKDRCLVYTRNGISVTESLETAVPASDGRVAKYERAYWRPEFARDGYPEVERSRTPVEGTLAIGDRSVLFVPPPGMTSVRIPFELVQEVEIHRNAATGETRSMIVRSCNGRFDIVSFRQPNRDEPDPDTITAAAARLRERIAVFQASADK